MFVTHPIGIIGETEAAQVLEKKGFRILEHNWRMGHLEMDLIAESKTEIAFVEVKARTSDFGDKLPEEYVDAEKRRRMVVAANAYIKHHHCEKHPRFDIIGIIVHPETKEIIYCNHMENAFSPTIRTVNTGSYSGSWKWAHRSKTIGSKRR